MLYLHIILLNRRVDLEGSCMMKDSEGGGSLPLNLCKLKQDLKYHWIVSGTHGWKNARTHITEVFTDNWLKSTMWANAERLLSFTSWWPAWRQLPPLPAGCATGQWVAWGWPAYLTNVAIQPRCCCSPQRLCRWHRSCQSCHSPTQWPPLALSERGHTININHPALEIPSYDKASLRAKELEIRRTSF